MISVRSRDGSKGLGFGLSIGAVGRKMEDAELEEGEAYSYQDNEDSDVRIDPDVALSYIDEKIQDVLGHFQKDFEGGVSAENLGAKFGGYGSFLPTTVYHRSPVWSHPRTPPKVQNHSVLRSPNNLQLDLNTGDGHNSIVSSVIPQSGRFGPSSSRSSLPVTKGPTGNGSMKQEVLESFIDGESLKHASGKKKIDCSSDQKTLKVRIKVGSDNLSTCKNAAIYSGLGLDVSPSSSLDDAPSGSEGTCQEWQHNPFESPTSILQIMTSFPIQEGPLLSPLPDDLIHLNEKERHSNDAKFLLDPRSGWENVGVLGNGNEVSRSSGKVSLEKKLKPTKVNDVSSESKTKSNKACQDKGAVIPKKEPEIDIVACEELVSNTLKLPLLSNLCSGSAEKTNSLGRTGDSLGKVNKVMVQDVMSIEKVEEELLELSSVRDGRKQKNGPATKVWEDKNDSPIDEITTFPKTDGYQKEGKTFESGHVNSKGKKSKHDELTNPLKKKPNEKVTLKEHDNMTFTPVKENAHPEVKNKLKGSPNHGTLAGNASSESLRIDFTLEPKANNRAKVVNVQPEFESEHFKAQRDLDKNKNRYRDFFGELDEEENQVDCLEMPSEDRSKSSDLIKKGIAITNGSLKLRTNVDENDKPLELDGNPTTTSNIARLSGNEPILDCALYTTDSVALEDFWVCCDTCQKWRLLPFGIYPKNLPEKWICNMLDWLPGMNRCSFSEEETTKALMAQRQAAASAILTQGNMGLVQDLVQNHPNYDLHMIPNGGKKKNGAKEITAGMVKGGTSQLSNSTKKKFQTSTKSRSLNDMNQSPLGSENGYPHLNLSNDTPMEKNKSKHKENQKGLRLHSSGEDAKIIKMKNKRDLDQDFSKASKKIKSKGMDFISDDRASDHSGTIIKLGHVSRTADLNASGGKEHHRQTDQSSKDSMYESKKRQQAFVRKANDEALLSINNGSLNVGDGEVKDIIKKRKVKESLETGGFLKELDESDCIKKAKIFKCEGKESSASKGSGRQKKKGNQIEHQQLRQHLGSLDDFDSFKRDIGSIHASVAATSSSSKVSGSCKTKSSFEVKGSPVESVSSSPMRISNQNNLHACRNFTGKDVSEDAVFFATNSPVRCSDGDDDGRSDQSRTQRKDKTSSVLHRDSLDSSLLQDAVHGRGTKSRIKVMPSPDMNNRGINGGLDNQSITISPGEQRVPHPYPDESRQNNTHFRSGKGSSSRLKDFSRSSNPNHYKDKIDTQNSLNELQRSLPPFEPKDGGKNESKKFGVRPEKAENKSVKKNSTKILSNENGATQLNLEERECLDVRVNSAAYRKDEMVNSKQNQLQGCNGEKSSNRNLSGRTDQVEMDNGRGQSLPLHTTGEGQNETTIGCPRPIGGPQKGNTVDLLRGDVSESNGVLKSQKQIKKADHQNGVHSTRHPTPNGRWASDNPSPARRDSSNQAATNALKEAKDLKHLADRLKNSGSNHEGTGMYFEAALKFLNGASLLESCNNGSKQSEMIQSMQIYSSTAKLCEFCAIEYEKSKDMAAAALAYKCMEVAYMRVVYSSHNNASRDRHELQTALLIVPPASLNGTMKRLLLQEIPELLSEGESPSSSASDVDNLNNPTTVDKATLHKGVSSPQVAGSHVITAKSRPSFVRLLNYAHDVNFAMEASRKSRIAFAAASEGAKIGDNILVFKRALDFNFHDVDGLLHLVRLAMESIGR